MEEFKLDIPRVMIFTKVNSARLNNALHAQYHRKQYELVTAVDKAKLKLPVGLPETWDKGISYETMLVRESAISSETAKLKDMDEKRDEQLTNIFGIIRAQRHSHKANIREAAIRLSDTLSPYESIQTKAYEMESGLLEGMKHDLTKRTAEGTTLGRGDEFENRFKLNDEFEKLHVGRRVENTDAKLPLISVVRPQTDAALEVVCQYIQVAYITAATADDKALLEQLVDRMNATSEAFKIMQRNLVVPRQPKEPKKPKDPKDPKQPKDPKDPKQPEDPKKPGDKKPEDPKKPDEKPKDPKKPKPDDGDDIHLPEE